MTVSLSASQRLAAELRRPAPRTAIEQGLPVLELNQLSLLETYNKHNYRPSNYIHKWWARRAGSVFRMIILGALSDPDADLWGRYYKPNDLGRKIVLDPFMGGGTTLIEALRLNCKVIGCDTNPVAWFMVKKAIEPVEIKALDKAMEELDAKVASTLSSLYKTRCDACSSESPVVFYLWVKTCNCLHCKRKIRLNTKHVLRYNGKNGSELLCPECHHVFRGSIEKASCPKCKHRFDPEKTFAGKGKFICPSCDKTNKIIEVARKEGKPLKNVLFCISYECQLHGLRFKAPDREDLRIYNNATRLFKKNEAQLLFPMQEIPDGLKTGDLLTYHYRYWHELFNPRQLYSLGTILKAIVEIEDQNVREFLLTVFSSSLEFNSMFCGYKGASVRRPGAVRHTFSHHAFVYPLEALENNIWGDEKNSGTFRHLYSKRLKRAKEFCSHPLERKIEMGNKIRILPITGEEVAGKLAQSPKEFLSGDWSNALLFCQDSATLGLPPKSVDAVITDPPYFDNVMYSELSDFFYVWLRLALAKTYDMFRSDLVEKTHEVIANETASKDSNFYLRGLTRVFQKCHELLKDEGLLVFTFHHKQEEAWEIVLKAIIDAGFYVVATYPVHSEMRVSVHVSYQDAVRYDSIIVCRKKEQTEEISWDECLKKIREESERTLSIFDGTPLWDVDRSVVVFGNCLKYYSRFHPKVLQRGGSLLSPHRAIESVLPIIRSLEAIRLKPSTQKQLW